MCGERADKRSACNGLVRIVYKGACGGNRAEWFCAPKAAVTTRSVFMAPLWFVSMSGASLALIILGVRPVRECMVNGT